MLLFIPACQYLRHCILRPLVCHYFCSSRWEGENHKKGPAVLITDLSKSQQRTVASAIFLWWIYSMKGKLAQLCPTLCDPMDYTVRGILPARILEWVAIPFSRGSQSRDQTQVSTLQADSLPAEPQEKPKNTGVGSLPLLQQIFPTQESNQSLLRCR